MKAKEILYLVLRLVAVVIMVQTLYFKFTGAEESVWIFTTVGMEPWGRYGVGASELIASLLLLYRPLAWVGATLASGLMGGAIMMHLTILGIEVKGDKGYLFFLALVVLVISLFTLWTERQRALDFIKGWLPKR